MSTTITQAIERSIEARNKEGGEVSRVMYSNMTTARGWIKRNDNEFTQNNVGEFVSYALDLGNA